MVRKLFVTKSVSENNVTINNERENVGIDEALDLTGELQVCDLILVALLGRLGLIFCDIAFDFKSMFRCL